MAANGAGDAMNFAKWLYGRATSHPIGQIEQTLATGKPPRPKAAPASPGIPPSTVPAQRFKRYGPATPAGKMKAALSKQK